ncbi:MAG: cupin domain-containing protein [Kiloniellales bacterium]
MGQQNHRGRKPVLIEHVDDLGAYAPPGHTGTVNRRLVGPEFCGRFELILGTVAPGGEAMRHHHEREHQVLYILEGEAEVTLGDDQPVRCRPGTVIRIPPGLDHRVVCAGTVPVEVIVLYSPPLAKR